METKQLTRQEVEANPYLARQVRDQAAWIRCELELDGVVRWSGRGYCNTPGDTRIRRFALRVLTAKGELHANPEDGRYYLPGKAA